MKRTVGLGATVGFALAVIALVATGYLSYQNLRRISRNDGLVVHTHEVLDELRDLGATLSEAESRQRSYLISGEQIYLNPYRVAASATGRSVVRLKRLTTDNPAQQERLARLQPMVAERVESLERGIGVYNTAGVEGARRYVLEGRGRREMEAIRSVLGEMQDRELSLLRNREKESRSSYNTAVLTVWSSTLLGLVLVGAAYRMTGRELETRRQGTDALARANDELEDRVERRTADLHSANESLQRSNRELEQFASVASHDLQEPLRKIQAFGDRLMTRCADELGEQGRDYLARMQSSATRMRSLIDALLSFSRVTTKAQPFGPVNLDLIASDVVPDLEDRVQRMGGPGGAGIVAHARR